MLLCKLTIHVIYRNGPDVLSKLLARSVCYSCFYAYRCGYISNEQSISYYWPLIGRYRRSIERWHCRWCPVTLSTQIVLILNLDFLFHLWGKTEAKVLPIMYAGMPYISLTWRATMWTQQLLASRLYNLTWILLHHNNWEQNCCATERVRVTE